MMAAAPASPGGVDHQTVERADRHVGHVGHRLPHQSDALFSVEQQALGRSVIYGHDQVVEQPGRPLRHVQVSHGHGVESSGIKSGYHSGVLQFVVNVSQFAAARTA